MWEQDSSLTVLCSYPSGNVIRKCDLELLLPGGWLNESLIDFQIEFIRNFCLTQKQKLTSHIFPSCFYALDVSIDDESCLFYKYQEHVMNCETLIIPCNDSVHWFLCILQKQKKW
jgi:Ulp1 family protease